VNAQTSTTGPTFTYTLPAGAPSVTAISPNFGPAAGTGTTQSVTITGTNLNTGGLRNIFFGNTASRNTTCASATSCTASVPSGIGIVHVTVQNNTFTSPATTADLFTYTPTITRITPTTGGNGGGTVVTINGSGFSTAANTVTVKFADDLKTEVKVWVSPDADSKILIEESRRAVQRAHDAEKAAEKEAKERAKAGLAEKAEK
jgi:hypothetical protein